MGSAARDQVPLLPLAPGVYRFRDEAGRVLYLGRATSLRRRVASYWGDLGGRAHLRRMVARIARVEVVACDSVHESEVWIQLSDSARAPGLAVVYQPPSAPSATARYFGPYLGGRQVRLAVSGLVRVFPLNYAGLDIAGTERDLARIHGVSADDRPALVAALAAVLDREPAAVAAVTRRLAERRGAAAQTLAFEVAARVQEEIEAIEWVTAPQRVTSATAADHDVCGWSDGLLVRFAVRGGRLTGWTQRACSAASARRHLTATAPHWQEFAQRNADLAARLNQPAANA